MSRSTADSRPDSRKTKRELIAELEVLRRRLGDLEAEEASAGPGPDDAEPERSRAALRESEERYRELVEMSPDAILVHAEGNIVFANTSTARLLGYQSPEELIGVAVLEIVPPADREEIIRRQRRTAASAGKIDFGEARLLKRDGSEVAVEVSAVPLRRGDAPAIQVVARDITARKRVEAALGEARETLEQRVRERTAELEAVNRTLRQEIAKRERAEKKASDATATLQEAVDALSEGFMLFDADERLVVCNRTYREYYKDVAHRPVPGMKFEAWARMVAESGLVTGAIGREEAWVAERVADFRNPTGPRDYGFSNGRWIQIREYKTASGGTAGLRLDITERKQAEDALRRSEARLRSVVNNSPLIVVLKDVERRYVMVNDHVLKVTGLSEEEIVGKTIHEVLDQDFAGPQADDERKVLATGVVIEREILLPTTEGRCPYLQVMFPVRDESGAIIGIGIFSTDLTERKLLEEQLAQAQKMEAVGNLTGGIAHEFNNLLTVIIGNLDLLDDHLAADGMPQELAQRAMNSALRGADLTERLLAFSRKQKLEPRPVDLGKLLPQMHDLLGRALEETVAVELDIARDLWTTLADPGQIQNAVLNLALNARDAMPEGGVIAIGAQNVVLDADDLGAHADAVPGPYVRVTIADGGVGMTPEVVRHAFEPFFTSKEVGKGTGLGLSMVYGFVRQSGGFTEIDSELGTGTTVALYLPKAEGEPGVGQAEHRLGDEEPGGEETILVVEDAPDVRRFAAILLTSLGYTVVEAEDGAAALAVLDSDRHIDLLFTDVVMPGGVSGIELAAECRRRRPGLKVIYTSGYNEETLSRTGKIGDGARLVQKPYRKKELARALRDALSG